MSKLPATFGLRRAKIGQDDLCSVSQYEGWCARFSDLGLGYGGMLGERSKGVHRYRWAVSGSHGWFRDIGKIGRAHV